MRLENTENAIPNQLIRKNYLYGFGNYKPFQKFVNAKKVECEHLECSKFDENFQIPKTNKFAKKPNQRSRPRADRTRSHKKLKKPKKFCHTDESE